jgi:Leucine-rich repeat (LRR) protein
MLSKLIFKLLILPCFLSLYGVYLQDAVLDRGQLEYLYPDYLSTKDFDFKSKGISIIYPDTFLIAPQMESLLLDKNQLVTLDKSVFRGLFNLQRLSISSNQLTESLDPSIFIDLKNLVYLYLDNNQLSSLGDGAIFNGLAKLQTLYLNGNKLVTLDKSSTFSGLVDLRRIYLNNNNLVSIDRNIFVGLFELEKIYLGQNPISSFQANYVKQLCWISWKCTVCLNSITIFC